MADLVIRGMKIPPQCVLYDKYRVIRYKCPFAFVDRWDVVVCTCPDRKRGRRIVNDYTETRHPDCPFLPLPERHGRLVDAREVLEKADKAPWFDGDASELGLLLGSEVTTIIPAEGGGEE